MKKFFKWYLDGWNKKDMKNIESLEFCWITMFLILIGTGVVCLFVLIYNWFH
jgi:hypothetical protein